MTEHKFITVITHNGIIIRVFEQEKEVLNPGCNFSWRERIEQLITDYSDGYWQIKPTKVDMLAGNKAQQVNVEALYGRVHKENFVIHFDNKMVKWN